MDDRNSWFSGVAQHAFGHIVGVAVLNFVGLLGIAGLVGGVFEGLTTPAAALRSPVPMPAWSLLLFLLVVGAVPAIWIVRRLQQDLRSKSARILELGGEKSVLRSLEGSRIVPARIDRVSLLTYQDLLQAVESAQGSELDVVAQKFVGTRVEWLCYFQDGHKEVGDYFRLYFAIDEHGEAGTIHCDVLADEFQEISAERKRRIRVVGRIRQVGRWNVELEDVCLTLYRHYVPGA
jgi:hypothetical protein